MVYLGQWLRRTVQEKARTMTCTGGRLAAFLAMDSSLSVPSDVRRSPTYPISIESKTLAPAPIESAAQELAASIVNAVRGLKSNNPGADIYAICLATTDDFSSLMIHATRNSISRTRMDQCFASGILRNGGPVGLTSITRLSNNRLVWLMTSMRPQSLTTDQNGWQR